MSIKTNQLKSDQIWMATFNQRMMNKCELIKVKKIIVLIYLPKYVCFQHHAAVAVDNLKLVQRRSREWRQHNT